jgi:hypothetical protein
MRGRWTAARGESANDERGRARYRIEVMFRGGGETGLEERRNSAGFEELTVATIATGSVNVATCGITKTPDVTVACSFSWQHDILHPIMPLISWPQSI